MPKIKTRIRFAINMCALDTADMPKQDGIIVVPSRPDGSWYAVCSTAGLSGYLSQNMGATPETPMNGHYTCHFQAGKDHTPAQLKCALEKAGFEVTFDNEPPWLE